MVCVVVCVVVYLVVNGGVFADMHFARVVCVDEINRVFLNIYVNISN